MSGVVTENIQGNSGGEGTGASAPAAQAKKEYKVNDAPARKDNTPRPGQYESSAGKMDSSKWMEKLNAHRTAKGQKPLTGKGEADAGKDLKKAKTPAPKRGDRNVVADPLLETHAEEEKVDPPEEIIEETPSPAEGDEPQEGEEGAEAIEGDGESEDDGKYKVNPKFSALGKEYELPKFLSDKVTNAEEEQQVKDIYSKAMGLDHVKMRQQETENRLLEVSETHNGMVDFVQDLKEIFADATKPGGNIHMLDDWFAQLQIPVQHILRYAAEKVQFMELEPAQQQAVLNQIQAQRNARTVGKQNLQIQKSANSSAIQARVRELDFALAKPDVAPIQQAFDSSPGRKPGDFKNLVQEVGEYTYYKSRGQTDLTVEQAIQAAISAHGLKANAPAATAPKAPAAQAGAHAPSPAPKVPVAPQRHKVPTIPGVQGASGSSPTKVKPKSIEDLKKLRDKAMARKTG